MNTLPAAALLRSGQLELVWPLLRHSTDPSLRSYLIRDLGRSGISPDAIARRLEVEPDTSARQALILSLGGFSSEQLPADRRKTLTARLLRLYRSDPGLHSAIDWLLRYGRQGLTNRRLDWQQGEVLREIDRELAGQPPKDRNGIVNLTNSATSWPLLLGHVEGRNHTP